MLQAPSPIAALLRLAARVVGAAVEVELLEESLPTALGVLASAEGAPLAVPDTRCDPRFAANPWVDGRLGEVRSYAAVPLLTPGGSTIGVLSASSPTPGVLGEAALDALGDAAAAVTDLVLRQRRASQEWHLATAVAEAHALVELAHDELGVRHDLLEAVLDTVDVGIAAVDASGRPTLVNSTLRAWLGLPDADLTEPGAQAPAIDLYEADGCTPMAPGRSPVVRALTEGVVEDAEVVLVSGDRAPITAVVRARALRDRTGATTGAVMSMTDVTAARAAARELERSNAELQQFAAVASHDLRAPLTVVDGYVELVEDLYGDVVDERGRAWLATARGGVRRMSALIDALLTYAQAGAAVLSPAPVDVAELLALVTTDLAASITAAEAHVITTGPLPQVRADAVQLRQLLQNLVGNAVKFRRPGSPVRVCCAVQAAPDGWTFSVADDGTGIPADRRAEVFRMFERAHPGVEGHGIGLATAERIVRRHGGRIWVEETPGGGATVRFTIPADPDPAPSTAATAAGSAAGAAGSADLAVDLVPVRSVDVAGVEAPAR